MTRRFDAARTRSCIDVLIAYVGADRLPQLITDLEEAGSDNKLWQEFMRRLRRQAGIALPSAADEPKALLDLMDAPE